MLMMLSPGRGRPWVPVSLGLCAGLAVCAQAQAQSVSWRARLQASNGQDEDRLGHAVALAGQTLFAGAPQASAAGIPTAGKVQLFRAQDSSNWVQSGELTAGTQAEPGAAFGSSLARHGSRLAVGAPDADGNAPFSGAVYMFERDAPGTWTRTQRLIANDGSLNDGFGSSVALFRNLLVVGAPRDNDAGRNTGAAYVFERPAPGAAWTQVARLVAPDRNAEDAFGFAVAIGAGQIAVGSPGADGDVAPGETEPTPGAGRVFVFAKDNGTWRLDEQLVEPDAFPDDAFGTGVTFAGPQLVVGAPGYDRKDVLPDILLNTGAVYAFARDNGRWQQVRQLTAPQPRSHEQLGSALSSDGRRILVGSHATRNGGPDEGRAFVWEQQGSASNWILRGELTPASTSGVDDLGFGTAVAMSGPYIAVGAALGTRRNGAQELGAVTVFEQSGVAAAPLCVGWLALGLPVLGAWTQRRRKRRHAAKAPEPDGTPAPRAPARVR